MREQERKLRLYFTSDVHGYLYPTTYGDFIEKPLGLFQCAGDFVKDENTLILDGGDMLQGSAACWYLKQVEESPEKLAQAMNDCGYDYYTLGNHDFNYGQEYQKKYREKNHAKCLCQNVTDENGKVLYPYEIRQMANGIRVGLVGIVTDYVNLWEKKENLVGIRITDPFEAAKQVLAKMKEKADFTICIYHGGFECDPVTGKRLSETTENVGYRICRELEFDLLLTGHQHMSVDGREVCGTWVVQPLDQAKEYHYLEVTETEHGFQIVSEKRSASLPGVCDSEQTKNLRDKYMPLQDKIQKWLNEPTGHLSHALLPGEKVDMALHGSEIADFMNRIQLHVSGAQISAVCVANEVSGFKESVSTRDVLATYPYPNTLVVCQMTGKQLKAAMERSAEYFQMDEKGTVRIADSFLYPKVEHYNYDYYLGVEYEIHPENPIGSRICALTYQGKPVKDEDIFSVCVNNYRFSGAGGYPMYPESPVIKEINMEMVEIIIDYFREFPYVEV